MVAQLVGLIQEQDTVPFVKLIDFNMDSLEKIRCFKLLSELKTAAMFEENVTREIVHLNLSGEITWQVPKVELIFLI